MLTAISIRRSLVEVAKKLGGLSTHRIRRLPAPGRATEVDVTRIEATEDRLFELVDGALVEKNYGGRESILAVVLGSRLWAFLSDKDLGVVVGASAPLRLRPNLVRSPDVSFISWDQIPCGEFPPDPIPDLYPDLAVEVLSEGNTTVEMERKLIEYFEAGCRLAWIVDPKTQTADVYTSPTSCRHLRPTQALDGGDVLPGFKLPLKELFACTRRRGK